MLPIYRVPTSAPDTMTLQADRATWQAVQVRLQQAGQNAAKLAVDQALRATERPAVRLTLPTAQATALLQIAGVGF